MPRAVRLCWLSSAYFSQLPPLSVTWQNVQSAASDAEKNPMVSMNWLTGMPLSTWTFLNTSSASRGRSGAGRGDWAVTNDTAVVTIAHTMISRDPRDTAVYFPGVGTAGLPTLSKN